MSEEPNSTWHETTLQLASLQQEYRAICQELDVSYDSRRDIQLRAWAGACVNEYLAIIEHYQAKHSHS